MKDLLRLAAAVRELPVSCGPVRLIGVDGHAGSGKSTFSAKLAEELNGAPVLHLDDLATHQELFHWMDRMRSQVVEPFLDGEDARYAPYDWTLRRFGPVRTVHPADLVIVEGVGAGRRALRPYLARLLWMDLDAESAWKRGRLRDGPALKSFWDGWTAAETQHFAGDPSRPFAHSLVRESHTGYEWFRNP